MIFLDGVFETDDDGNDPGSDPIGKGRAVFLPHKLAGHCNFFYKK
jgi:hypothetical protein